MQEKERKKSGLDRIFCEALHDIARVFKIVHSKISLQVLFTTKKTTPCLHLCINDKPVKCIPFEYLITKKMIGIRISAVRLQQIFAHVHKAFMQHTGEKNPDALYLILYESQRVNCCCVGIINQQKAICALKIEDVFEGMNLGNEQLN